MMVQIDTKLKTRQVGMPEEMSGKGIDFILFLLSHVHSVLMNPRTKGSPFPQREAGQEMNTLNSAPELGKCTEKFLTLSLLVPQSRTLKKGREATKLPFFCSERNEVI